MLYNRGLFDQVLIKINKALTVTQALSLNEFNT